MLPDQTDSNRRLRTAVRCASYYTMKGLSFASCCPKRTRTATSRTRIWHAANYTMGQCLPVYAPSGLEPLPPEPVSGVLPITPLWSNILCVTRERLELPTPASVAPCSDPTELTSQCFYKSDRSGVPCYGSARYKHNEPCQAIGHCFLSFDNAKVERANELFFRCRKKVSKKVYFFVFRQNYSSNIHCFVLLGFTRPLPNTPLLFWQMLANLNNFDELCIYTITVT